MARTNCRGAAKLSRGLRRLRRLRTAHRGLRLGVTAGTSGPPEFRVLTVAEFQWRQVHESFTVIHSSSGRDHAPDGRRAAGGLGCIPATASLGAAGSRLPNDPGGDVLSGSRSGGDGLVGDFPVGAAIRPGARPDPDDFDEFIWQFDYHVAVRPRSEY